MSKPTAMRLVEIADIFGKACGYTRSTMSMMIFADTRVLDRIQNGGTLHCSSYDYALAWLSAHWPDRKERKWFTAPRWPSRGLRWPRAIAARPDPLPVEQMTPRSPLRRLRDGSAAEAELQAEAA